MVTRPGCGQTWTTLDVCKGEVFSEPHQRRVFGVFAEEAKAAPDFPKLTRHFGSVKGAWPRIVEN